MGVGGQGHAPGRSGPCTVMGRIPTFRSMTDRIYDGGTIIIYYSTGLLKMIVGVLTCHTQYT
jgi:hypothetical protein